MTSRSKKTSIYLTAQDSARIDAVFEAMKKDLGLRHFDIKWSDAFRLLLRQALTEAEEKYGLTTERRLPCLKKAV